jgi:hypothetical protein
MPLCSTRLLRAPRRWRRLISLSSLASLVSGCAPDLGPCDMGAASEVVYSPQGLVATKGQALVYNSCGQGAFCHSANAKGSARYGVPLGLDFDMLPSPTGWPEVANRRADIWQSVTRGDMPPGHAGATKTGNTLWSFDARQRKDAPQLPALLTNDGKAALRNWLACGAPVVARTQVPTWALPPSDDDAGGAGPSDWHQVYASIIKPTCAVSGCHDASASGGLSMTDECGAYTHLLETGACGRKRVVPGDGSSLLLTKLESRMPSCGGGMPVAGALPMAATAQVRAWVEAGAHATVCK